MSAAISTGINATQAKILEGLNPQQQEVVLNYQGPSLVTAGPGSGKTRTVIARAAFMIAGGVDPASILLFTFTRKAASEMQERIRKAIGDDASLVTVSTYHSFCARQMRNYAYLHGRQRNFSIYDEEDQAAIFKEIFKKMNIGDDIYPASVQNIISRFKDHYLTPSQALREAINESNNDENNIKVISAKVYDIYQKELEKSNAFDFDDLIFYMVKTLEEHPAIKKQMQDIFRYVTADEVQDSSLVDARLIFNLMNPTTKNMCLVGDSDQAIYSFRGANAKNLYSTAKSYGFIERKLERNYRSTRNILDASQCLISANQRLDSKHIYSEDAVGDKIYHLSCINQEQESAQVANVITALKAFAEKNGNEFKYSDIAILCRAAYLSRSLESQFLRTHIPYTLIKGNAFYERKEVKDIMCYVRYAMNPRDLTAFARILNTPKRGIGQASEKSILNFLSNSLSSDSEKSTQEEQLSLISDNFCGKMDLSEDRENVRKALKILSNDGKRYSNGAEAILHVLNKLWKLIDSGCEPADFISRVIKLVDYKTYLYKTEKDADERWENLLELQNIAAASMDIADFVHNFSLNTSLTQNQDDTDSVQIMTMHASKGLEFPIVFIVDANEDICPNRRCKSKELVEEERRLFFVAMTRAQKLLVISSTESTMVGGHVKPATVSRFVNQIQDFIIER